MSEMPTYLSCIVNDGKLAAAQAFIQKRKLSAIKFIAGDAFNFTPTETGTTVSGNVVYTGYRNLISGYISAKDTFKYNITFPESSGDFNIGNIMLYLQGDNGVVFPFMWVVFKIPYQKQKQEANTVGNRFVFEFIEKIINATDILSMTIVPSEYASLAGFINELSLPIPSAASFQQFYIHEPNFSPVPIIGARRSVDNSYWGMPLYSKIGDPFFGVIDGGRAGAYKSNAKFFWGGRLNMSNNKLINNYGKLRLTDTPTVSFGGTPLNENSQ